MQIVFLILNLIISGSIQYVENDISMEICHTGSIINIEDDKFEIEVCFNNHTNDTIMFTSYLGFDLPFRFNKKRFMSNVRSYPQSYFLLVLYHDDNKLYEQQELVIITDGWSQSVHILPDVIILFPYSIKNVKIKYSYNLHEMPPNGNYKGQLYYYQNRESILGLTKNPINLDNPEEILNIMQVEMFIPEKDTSKVFNGVIESEFFDIHICK